MAVSELAKRAHQGCKAIVDNALLKDTKEVEERRTRAFFDEEELQREINNVIRSWPFGSLYSSRCRHTESEWKSFSGFLSREHGDLFDCDLVESEVRINKVRHIEVTLEEAAIIGGKGAKKALFFPLSVWVEIGGGGRHQQRELFHLHRPESSSGPKRLLLGKSEDCRKGISLGLEVWASAKVEGDSKFLLGRTQLLVSKGKLEAEEEEEKTRTTTTCSIFSEGKTVAVGKISVTVRVRNRSSETAAEKAVSILRTSLAKRLAELISPFSPKVGENILLECHKEDLGERVFVEFASSEGGGKWSQGSKVNIRSIKGGGSVRRLEGKGEKIRLEIEDPVNDAFEIIESTTTPVATESTSSSVAGNNKMYLKAASDWIMSIVDKEKAPTKGLAASAPTPKTASITVRPCDISGSKVILPSGLEITMRIATDSKTIPESALSILLLLQLSGMNLDQRMNWNGELNGTARGLENLFRMSCGCDNEDWQILKFRALLKAHHLHPFNNCLMVEVVSECGGDDYYREYCAGYLSDFAIAFPAHGKAEQVKCIVAALGIAELQDPKSSRKFEETLRALTKSRLFSTTAKSNSASSSRSANFPSSFHQCKSHLNLVVTNISPCLAHISSKSFGNFGTKWSEIIASATMEAAMPDLEKAVKNKMDIEDSEFLFNVYLAVKDVAKVSGKELREKFQMTFERCLGSWINTVNSKAEQQLSKIIEQESRRHVQGLEQSEHVDWTDGITDLGMVFKSCQTTWKRLAWPDKEKSLEFGIEVTRTQNRLLGRYIQALYDIVMEDEKFESSELVVILNSIAAAVIHLESMIDAIQELLGKKEKLPNKVEELFSAIGEGREKAFEDANLIVRTYCSGEAKKFANFGLDRLHDENGGDTCLLGHVNALLEYFHDNLEMGLRTSTYNTLIRSELFSSVERRFSDLFSSGCIAGSGQVPLLKTAVRELQLFQRETGSPPSERMTRLLERLEAREMSSTQLLGAYLKRLSEAKPMTSSSAANVVTGRLKFRACIPHGEKRVLVKLESLHEVKKRKGKDKCNPGLVIRIHPGGGGESRRTPVYGNSEHVLFDWSKEAGEEYYSFTTPSAETETFLCLKLYDHSVSRTHKYILGFVAIPLSSISRTGMERIEADLSNIVLESSAEFLELKDRSSFRFLNPIKKKKASSHLDLPSEVRRFLERSSAMSSCSAIHSTKCAAENWM